VSNAPQYTGIDLNESQLYTQVSFWTFPQVYSFSILTNFGNDLKLSTPLLPLFRKMDASFHLHIYRFLSFTQKNHKWQQEAINY